MALIFFKIIYFTLLILLINANNDRFAVLCNRYFSECDWRFIWCQFVADVKENPGGDGEVLLNVFGCQLTY